MRRQWKNHALTAFLAAVVGMLLAVGALAEQSVKWVEDKPAGVTVVRSRLDTPGGRKLARDTAKFTVHAEDLKAGEYTDPATGQRMAFRYFVPDKLAPNARVPVVLFLHGLGEAGGDNVSQLRHEGPLEFVQPEWQKAHPCILVAPQHAKGTFWLDGTFDQPSANLRMAVAIVDKLAAETGHVDARRLYVTGLSSGGIGAWDAIKKFPGKFAAAAPVSAWYDAGGPAKHWPKRIPTAVWAFYNANDGGSLAKGCNGALAKVAKLGGEARLTVYATNGHNAWTAAYKEPDFATWLFRQQLAGVAADAAEKEPAEKILAAKEKARVDKLLTMPFNATPAGDAPAGMAPVKAPAEKASARKP